MPAITLKKPAAADHLALNVASAGSTGQPLIAFDLAGRALDRLAQGIGLVHLGGDYARENWLVPGPVRHEAFGHGWQAVSGKLMSIALGCRNDPGSDPEAVTADLYRELIVRVRQAGYPELLRIWNYMPGINEGEGDSERYRRFCIGRGRALNDAGLDDAAMPAATAIGTHDREIRVIALAGKRPGESFENPRQVSSWHYPPRYGPRSPAFARATAIALAGGHAGLLISGTASVIGHATVHPGNVLAQADEAAANVETLLRTAAERLGDPRLASFGPDSLARVYVRHPGDWPAVAGRLRARWPRLALAGLRGEICRRDLLVEIEAWHRTAATPV